MWYDDAMINIDEIEVGLSSVGARQACAEREGAEYAMLGRESRWNRAGRGSGRLGVNQG